MARSLKSKKVLVFGLGILGGGAATASWLLDRGAQVTVTDLKDAKALASAVKRVEHHLQQSSRDGKEYRKRKELLTWALGGHSNALVDAADLVVVNPDVAVRSPYIQRALRKKIPVANEGTLFYGVWTRKTVGITGTRGKTTTANWTHHFIAGSVLTGNSTTKPFQAAMEEKGPVAVTELSSFILELTPFGPDVAVITNLYRDHLSRHGTMEEYAKAKANIFTGQTRQGMLILNAQDEWTPFFLAQGPRGRVRYFSSVPLADGQDGVWQAGDALLENGKPVLDIAGFASAWGEHNVSNLMAAALAARCAGVPWSRIQARIASLPQVPFRQETVFQGKTLRVINDTTATSPEGAVAAVRRWGGPNCVLIAGGTDRELDYRAWAQAVPKHLLKTNLILLEGSATLKMRKALGTWGRGVRMYPTLEAAWRAARARSGLFVSSVILFSPGAKSFELFANEFDRGQQFNALVKRDCT